jgi:Zn-dependent protease
VDIYNFLVTVAIYAIPVVFAITLHEAAHGFVARHFGDTTAYMLGRITLNPVKHIDLVGTIVLPLATVFLSGFMFGWAKPVPVNERNLRDPKRDMMWVAAAGPGANLAMAGVWAVIAKGLLTLPDSMVATYWFAVAEAGVLVNVVFAILNLFPLLPLDGGRIVAALLPGRASYAYARLEPYGLIVLVVLIVTGALSWILSPLVRGTLSHINSFMGLR